MENKGIYMQGTNHTVWKELEVPVPKAGEVLVEVKAVGICGSDLHYYEHGRIGDFVVEGDFILGHEAAGKVVGVGQGVTRWKVGDRIAMEPGVACGKCELCMEGKYNLCKKVEFFATPPYQGVFRNYVTHPEHMCFALPDNVSYTAGALVEPLSVGLHATAVGEVKLGQSVLIFGAGCIGISSFLSAKARGGAQIIVVDVQETRLKKVRELGAHFTINSKLEDVASRIAEITKGEGVNLVIETSGAQACLLLCADVIKPGGTVVLVGMTPESISSFDFMKLMSKEGQIRTIFRYRNMYSVAINSIAGGIIPIEDIVSHRFPFSKTGEALDYVAKNPGEVTKAVITMD